jgi:hypothetical protein
MLKNKKYQQINHLFLAVFVMIVIVTMNYFEGNVGFNLADEGFLWYGVKRVLAGDVPIRDFMSYDPGRYYWSAFWMKIFGDSGILSLRLSVSIFQGLGLFFALLILSETLNQQKHHYFYLLVVGLILVLWMFPRHKLFDISLSIFLIYGLAFLINRPVLTRYFILGILIGLVAVFGRNHGVYGFLASLSLIFWLYYKKLTHESLTKAFTYWILGIFIGFSPILLMLNLVPEFASAFLDSIYLLFAQQTTNLTLPVPWPWKVDLSGAITGAVIGNLLVGAFFVLLILISAISAIIIVFYKSNKAKLDASFIASGFLLLPYAHFAFSRADVSHLAQGIFPLLILMLSIISRKKLIVKWFLVLVLFCFSIVVALPIRPFTNCYITNACNGINLKNDLLLVSQTMEQKLLYIDYLVSKYAPNDESFLILPSWPAVYAIYDRKSPIWEIYAVFPRSREFETKELEKVMRAKPKFVILDDVALDGQDSLRFKYTHPIINSYIDSHYLEVNDNPQQSLKIYIEKESNW